MDPRPAATVILGRDLGGRLELLMVRRTPAARFMAGAWVFPGGALDAGDGNGPDGLRRAAIRELSEEAGVTLAPSAELVALARWITPASSSIRFDTWFYLARAPERARPRVDGAEIVDFRWLAPVDALAADAAGALPLAFPTRTQLQRLSAFESVAALLDHARESDLEPIEPREIRFGEHVRLALPGDPDY